MHDAQHRRRRALLVLAFYAVATLLLAWPHPLHLGETVPRAVRPDTWLNVWALAWTSEHLVTDPAGLLDANIFHPRYGTLAYTDHFVGQALIGGIAYWVASSPVAAYNLAWYAALLLGGWFGYLLAERLLRGQPGAEAAALIAGAVFLLVPGKRTAFAHLQALSLQAVPLALLAFHLLLERPRARRALWLALATGWAGLCSWYTAGYVALLLPAMVVAALCVDERARRGRWLLLVAAAGAGALALLAPLASGYAAVQAELGFARPRAELVATALRPIDLVSSWSWLHEGWLPRGSGAGGHFPGVAVTTLAVLGIVVAWRRSQRWPLVYGALGTGFLVLALGPELPLGSWGSMALPYEVLYRWVPGFDALRNPYRAALFGVPLLAIPAATGARVLLARVPRRRWRVGVAVALVVVHCVEAWPGPQEIVPLPEAPTAAHRWIATQGRRPRVLELPLPEMLDDNARYQLWSVGTWNRLANGHSGLFPAEFVALHELPSGFPDPRWLEAVRRRIPLDYVLVHYGSVPGGEAVAEAARRSFGLEEVWSDSSDVVYRISNGAPAGRIERRLRGENLGERLVVELGPGREVPPYGPLEGCAPVLTVDGAEQRLRAAGGAEPALRAYRVDGLAPRPRELVEVALWLRATVESTAPSAPPPVRLEAAARLDPSRTPWPPATILVNGDPVVTGGAVTARLDADSGALLGRETAGGSSGAVGDAVRRLLESATPGDLVAVAVAGEPDPLFLERLRLLLTRAGAVAPTVDAELVDRGAAWAFVGRMGAPPGSATEAFGATRARVAATEDAPGCLDGPIAAFRFERAAAGAR